MPRAAPLLPSCREFAMKIHLHELSPHQLPVDFFADPDGAWSYESLVRAAGFDPDAVPAPLVGALAVPWGGHPEGAAVVAGPSECNAVVVIIECEPRATADPLGRAA
jgi:hypothetical protein